MKFEVSEYKFWVVLVAPYTGAWIEIFNEIVPTTDGVRRTLHGCVD